MEQPLEDKQIPSNELLSRVEEICKTTQDPVNALNLVESILQIKKPDKFLPFLSTYIFKSHVQKILLTMQSVYLAKRSVLCQHEFLVLTKYLERLLPAAKSFIITRFISNYGSNSFAITSAEQTVLGKNSNKHVRHEQSRFFQQEGHEASPHFIHFDDIRNRFTAFVTIREKRHQIGLPKMEGSFAQGRPSLFILSPQKNQLAIVFIWEPTEKISSDEGLEDVCVVNHLYVFNIDIATLACHEIFQRTSKRDSMGRLLSLHLIDAGFSFDQSLFFLILSTGMVLLKIKPGVQILKEVVTQDKYSDNRRYKAIAFSADSLVAYVVSLPKNYPGSISIPKIEALNTDNGDLLYTLVSNRTFLGARIQIKPSTTEPTIMLVIDTLTTIWKVPFGLPEVFFQRSVIDKEIKKSFFDLSHARAALELIRQLTARPWKITVTNLINRNKIQRLKEDALHTVAAPEQKFTFQEEVQNSTRTDDKTFYCALAIEGEGLQAILSAFMLKKIEEETGSRTADLFDVVTGSSFGAIAGLGAVGSTDESSPVLPPSSYAELLYDHADEIFSKSDKNLTLPLYDSKNFLRLLTTKFGHAQLSNSLTRFVLPCRKTVKQNSKSEGIVKPFVCDSLDAQRNSQFDIPLDRVSAYAIAHLPYFPPYTVNSQEGKGLINASDTYRHNSAAFLFERVLSKNIEDGAHQNIILLTLGPGKRTESNTITHENLTQKLGLNYVRMEPLNKRILETPTDALCPLNVYIEDASDAYKGWEGFFRRLQENKAKKHSLALLES